MFKSSGTLITLILLGSIASFVWYKIYALNSEVQTITYDLERNISKVNMLKLELAIKEGNIKEIQEALDAANSNLQQITLKKELIEKEFNRYKEINLTKKLSDKQIIDLINSDPGLKSSCEYGIKLNTLIKGLKYEDL